MGIPRVGTDWHKSARQCIINVRNRAAAAAQGTGESRAPQPDDGEADSEADRQTNDCDEAARQTAQ